FERNDGQVNPQVKFFSRTRGYSVFLTNDEAVMRFSAPKDSTIRMKLIGRNRNSRIDGADRLDTTTNYLLGNGSSQHTNIASFKKVRYSDVYPGIDMEYHGNGRLLEYDFVVQPGSNPADIRLDFSGISGQSISPDGDLVLRTEAEPLVQRK